MTAIDYQWITTDEVTLRVTLAGDPDAPVALLLHGVPELWYSWRHQLPALADVGYRAIAPDVRGCGGSSAPKDVASYSMRHLIGDVVGILDGFGVEDAVLVGHDWGAETAWQCARAEPDRVRAVVGISVPFTPRAPEPPTALAERFSPDVFSFVRYFQEPGVAEAELEADPRRSLRLLLYGLSGDAPPGLLETLFLSKPRDARLLDGIPEPPGPLGWLTDADLDYVAAEYTRTGFTGALNRYRNLDRDWVELEHLDETTIEPAANDAPTAGRHGSPMGRSPVRPPQQPVLFLGGERDSAVVFGDLGATRALPGIRDVVVLPGCGHWVQQERPVEVNTAIIGFLRSLE